MKRKIIKQGNNTLTITLPRKWTDKFNVKAGDELELLELNNTLQLMTKGSTANKSIDVDVSELNRKLTKYVLVLLYKAGYDTINITYESREQLEVIQDAINKNLM